MALRTVVFDYGMVLTGPPLVEAHDALLRITGLSAERFEGLYWADRIAYDAGRLTGLEFWQKLGQDAGLSLSADELGELNDWDARMWTTENPPMLCWQKELKKRSFLTAILSNVGDHVHARMEQEFAWLSRFDVLVWSYQLGITKPDARIYLHTLKELGVRADEVLFLDDRPVNIEGARAVGMRGLLFTNADKLREDLKTEGLDTELPLL